jgi:hypothetical protein
MAQVRAWVRLGLLVVAIATSVLPSCRKAAELPAVPGAKVVVPFSAVVLFREMPVSSGEFDTAGRRWTEASSPRFDDGTLRSRPGPDGGTIYVEIPPLMAFRNRGNDCGSQNDRRICALPWDQAVITLCGRPLQGHIEIRSDKLGEAGLFVCRVINPPREDADGGYVYAERDCTKGQRIELREVSPDDLSFRIGDYALVADPGATYDRTVCDRVATMEQKPVL